MKDFLFMFNILLNAIVLFFINVVILKSENIFMNKKCNTLSIRYIIETLLKQVLIKSTYYTLTRHIPYNNIT